MRYQSVGVIFTWVLMTLALFRVTRFVTTDVFPPMLWIREKLEAEMGEKWGELVSCNWCASMYIVTIAYAIVAHVISTPLPILQAAATMGVVGFLGNYDD